jgi:GntR family transcriptional regulator, vanillate catabolism transcriptional regulator
MKEIGRLDDDGRRIAIGRPRLPDGVADHLRTLIIDGDLAPGTQLVQADIARRLGVSRTPLREALQILERDGLLQISNGNQTVEVTTFTPAELIEILQVRMAVERLGAGLCAQRGLDTAAKTRMRSWLAEMEGSTSSLDMARYGRNHAEFHSQLLLLSGNSRLATLVPMVRLSCQLHTSRSLRDQGVRAGRLQALQRTANRQHRAIMRALFAQDVETVQEAVTSHLETAICNLTSAATEPPPIT